MPGLCPESMVGPSWRAMSRRPPAGALPEAVVGAYNKGDLNIIELHTHMSTLYSTLTLVKDSLFRVVGVQGCERCRGLKGVLFRCVVGGSGFCIMTLRRLGTATCFQATY